MKSCSEPKCQLAIIAEAPERTEGLCDTAPLEWLLCKQTGDYTFDFCRDDTVVSSVNLENARFDLSNLSGIIVVGTTDVFEAIKNRWSVALPSAQLIFKRVPEWESKDILRASLECIVENLTLQRNHSGRAALQLATYRREFERLQHSFACLEEYASRQSFPRSTEIFEYPPDGVSVNETSGRSQFDETAEPGARMLIQDLPVNSCGLSSIAIHISAKPEANARPLRIKLKAVETGRILGEWLIDAQQVQLGWVELALNSAIDEPALSLVISVEWPPDASGWGLTLGPPHPHPEFCARTEAGQQLASPLSLRVFGNLPGVRVAATTAALRPINSSPVLAEFIPYEAYASVLQIFPPREEDKPNLVSFDRGMGCVTVHPRIGGPMIARMSLVVARNAWRISAQIHLAHERASPTQFAMMVCPPGDESKELARLRELESPAPSFSGWKTLSPLETKSISLILPESLGDQLSIYLATRQAPESTPEFAWARFSKFEINLLPTSAHGNCQTGRHGGGLGDLHHIGDDLVVQNAQE